MTMRIDDDTRNALADAFAGRVDAGSGDSVLQLRTGPPPASIGDPAAGTLLAEFTLPSPAFGSASGGTITANAITDVEGEDDGTVGHFRVVNGDGDAVEDSDSVGTSGTELVLNTLSISSGVAVAVSSWQVTMPAQ